MVQTDSSQGNLRALFIPAGKTPSPLTPLTPSIAEADNDSLVPVAEFTDRQWGWIRRFYRGDIENNELSAAQAAMREIAFGYSPEQQLTFPNHVLLAIPTDNRPSTAKAMGIFSKVIELAQDTTTDPELLKQQIEDQIKIIPTDMDSSAEAVLRDSITQIQTATAANEPLSQEVLTQMQQRFTESFPPGQIRNVAIEVPEDLGADPMAVLALKIALGALTGGFAFLGPIDYLTQTARVDAQQIPQDVINGLAQYDPVRLFPDVAEGLSLLLVNPDVTEADIVTFARALEGESSARGSDTESLAAQGSIIESLAAELVNNRQTFINDVEDKKNVVGGVANEVSTFVIQKQLPIDAQIAMGLWRVNNLFDLATEFAPAVPGQTIPQAIAESEYVTPLGLLASFIPSRLPIPGADALSFGINPLDLANDLSRRTTFGNDAVPNVPTSVSFGVAVGPAQAGITVSTPLPIKELPPEQQALYGTLFTVGLDTVASTLTDTPNASDAELRSALESALTPVFEEAGLDNAELSTFADRFMETMVSKRSSFQQLATLSGGNLTEQLDAELVALVTGPVTPVLLNSARELSTAIEVPGDLSQEAESQLVLKALSALTATLHSNPEADVETLKTSLTAALVETGLTPEQLIEFTTNVMSVATTQLEKLKALTVSTEGKLTEALMAEQEAVNLPPPPQVFLPITNQLYNAFIDNLHVGRTANVTFLVENRNPGFAGEFRIGNFLVDPERTVRIGVGE